VLPPTTTEAQQYFFVKIKEYTALASTDGKGKIDYQLFSWDWNQSADGKDCYYATAEDLSAYAKTWEKVNNICVS
jgi:hypothetical protein